MSGGGSDSTQLSAGWQVISFRALDPSKTVTQDGVIVMSGNLADEIMATDTFFDRLLPNERNMNNNLGGATDALYLNLHTARAGTASAITAWAQLKPSSKDTLSELYSIRAYTEDFFGEIYCSGVPFSGEGSEGTAGHGTSYGAASADLPIWHAGARQMTGGQHSR